MKFLSPSTAFVCCNLLLTVPVAALPPAATGADTGRFPDASYAHALLVRTGEEGSVPNNLLDAKADLKNWQSRFDGSPPGSRVAQDGNALKTTVGGTPTRDWQAQLYRDTSIEAGKTHTLRFRARAQTRHFLTVGSQVEDDGPYRNLGLLETVLVTPQ